MRRHTATLLLVVALLAAAAAPAAGLGVDTETTDTSDQSDLTDGATLSSNFGAFESNVSHLEFNTSSEDPLVKLSDADTGEVFREYPAADLNQTYRNDSDDHYYYARNISHDELANLPVDAGETKDLTIELVNNASADDPATVEFNVSLTAVSNRSVLGAHANASNLSTADGDDGITLASVTVFDDPPTASYAAENVGIDGANSTVRVALLDNTAAASVDNATAGLEPGDWTLAAPMTVGGRLLPTYYDEAPNGTDGSYAVYEPDEAAVKAHLGEAYADRRSADVSVAGGDRPPLSRVVRVFGVEGLARVLGDLT